MAAVERLKKPASAVTHFVATDDGVSAKAFSEEVLTAVLAQIAPHIYALMILDAGAGERDS